MTEPALRASSGKLYPLVEIGDNSIGSNAGCTVFLYGTSIALTHAIIRRTSLNDLTLIPVGGKILVNGTQVSSSYTLADGETITIASITLTVVKPNVAPRPTASPRPTPPMPAPLAPVSPRPSPPMPTPLPPPMSPLAPPSPVSLSPSSSPLTTPSRGSTFSGSPPQLLGEVLFVSPQHEEDAKDSCWLALFKGVGTLVLIPILGIAAVLLGSSVGQRRRVVVQSFRVEDTSTGTQFNVRAEGYLTSDIGMGDEVAFYGRDIRGTIHMNWAFNQTTMAEVRLKQHRTVSLFDGLRIGVGFIIVALLVMITIQSIFS